MSQRGRCRRPRCSSQALNCPSGFYQDAPGQATCKPCPMGSYCYNDGTAANYTTPAPCPPGYFCPSGTKFPHEWPCPMGYYRDRASF